MGKRKKIKTRGKIQFGRYFKEFGKGDLISVVRESSLNPKFPEKIQGKTGLIKGKRGRAYIVEIKDKSKEKKFLIEPIHLKKMNKLEKQRKQPK